MSAYFMLFLLALGAALELVQSNSITIAYTDSFINAKDPSVALQSQLKEKTASGAEVLQSVYHIRDIGAPIEVRSNVGTLYYEPEEDASVVDVTGIDVSLSYGQLLERSSDGAITRIIFYQL